MWNKIKKFIIKNKKYIIYAFIFSLSVIPFIFIFISLNKSCSSFSLSIIFREFFKSAAVSLDLFNNTAEEMQKESRKVSSKKIIYLIIL